MEYVPYDEYVLLPYEITLLSNRVSLCRQITIVLLPYEITLLSNESWLYADYELVLLPYEITLLSNSLILFLSGLKFYYLMKLHYSQTFR